jgi:hypothetical protein
MHSCPFASSPALVRVLACVVYVCVFIVAGQMTNVCRIFNDNQGVELVQRTGRSPKYTYQSIGCSMRAMQRMLTFAKTQCIGKPFSNVAMARSIVWPRKTNNESFFCAELVAAILKEGGLIDASCNPGAATPQTLYELYRKTAASSGNPYVLRDKNCTLSLNLTNHGTVVYPNHGMAPTNMTMNLLMANRPSSSLSAPPPSTQPSYYYRNSYPQPQQHPQQQQQPQLIGATHKEEERVSLLNSSEGARRLPAAVPTLKQQLQQMSLRGAMGSQTIHHHHHSTNTRGHFKLMSGGGGSIDTSRVAAALASVTTAASTPSLPAQQCHNDVVPFTLTSLGFKS